VSIAATVLRFARDAIVAIPDPIAEVAGHKYKVAVPTSVLYAQFEPGIHPYIIHLAFKELGFDEVIATTTSCAAVARACVKYMERGPRRRPVIATDCPATVRLIQVKYPELVELISPWMCPGR